jgi:hypothetical protein
MMNDATTMQTVEAMRAALANGDYKAIIKLSSGTGWSIWNEAMNAYYAPTGTHPSRCDANDRPLPETLVQFPDIAFRMQAARERLPELVDRLERDGWC